MVYPIFHFHVITVSPSYSGHPEQIWSPLWLLDWVWLWKVVFLYQFCMLVIILNFQLETENNIYYPLGLTQFNFFMSGRNSSISCHSSLKELVPLHSIHSILLHLFFFLFQNTVCEKCPANVWHIECPSGPINAPKVQGILKHK